MKNLFIAVLVVTFASGSGFAQEAKSGAKSTPIPKDKKTVADGKRTVPNPRSATAEPKKHEDSAEFAKAFKEFYPLIKPEKSVKEEADTYFKTISRSFKSQGIDSAEAAKAAFKGLDDNADYRLSYENYRNHLSAKELKAYMVFLKTPEGKGVIETLPQIFQKESSQVRSYISQTMNSNLQEIRRAGREKMKNEQPPVEDERTKQMRELRERQRKEQQDFQKKLDSLSKKKEDVPITPGK